MYADGKGNFFADEETYKAMTSSSSTSSETSTSKFSLNSLFKDITILDILIIVVLAILAIMLPDFARFFVLGALVMYIGVVL
ncbi:MAG: hypothetical protein QXV17_08270 [Candidatus Micrarchaeaceae archaeon]